LEDIKGVTRTRKSKVNIAMGKEKNGKKSSTKHYTEN